MTVVDLPAVFQVRLSTRENAVTMEELEKDYGVTPDSFAHALSTSARGWLCEEARKVVGFAAADMSNGQILVVAVLPEHEERGVGGTLLTRAQDWLFSAGHEEIWLLANPDETVRASGFYRRYGWQPSGELVGCDRIMRLKKQCASLR